MPEMTDRWAYLTSKTFRVRQAMAAHFAEGLDVLEIGGWRTPCPCAHVNVDPLAEDCDKFIEPVNIPIEDYLARAEGDEWLDDHGDPYAVVALGLDLPDIGPLTEKLLQGAQRVVVETARLHIRGVTMMDAIAHLLEPTHTRICALQLGIYDADVPVAEGYPVYNERVFHVLEKKDHHAADQD